MLENKPQQLPECSTAHVKARRSGNCRSPLPVPEHPVTPRGCPPWPATLAFHVNIGRNDTLGEHGCYYGLPTTQRSSVPPRPEEGRRRFRPDQNDRSEFIPAFLQRLSGGEGLENLLRGFTRPDRTRADQWTLSNRVVKRPKLCGLTSADRGWSCQTTTSTCHIGRWWSPERCF